MDRASLERPESMRRHAARIIVGAAGLWLSLGAVSEAGRVELKNGMVIEGRPVSIQTLTRKPLSNPGPTTIYHVVMVQNAWQRTFVPMRQVPDSGLDLDVELGKQEEFKVPQIRQSRGLVVQNAGSLVSATPYDGQFGRRTVTLATARGNLPVVQGITKITPDHIEVSSLTHVWDFGVGLSGVPADTIDSILHNPLVCNPDEAQDRLARARFYVAAEWYPQAFGELDSIAHDFPSLQDRVSAFREELLQIFGRHVLRELSQRRRAGQFELADASVRKIPLSLLHGSVQREVQQFLTQSDQDHADLERVTAMLGDYQASITDAALRERVSMIRSQLLVELDLAGLERLRPFLQAAEDPQLSGSEKLALAYSGWILGPAAVSTDLTSAVRLWEARGLVREYIRADDPAARNQLFDELRQLEGLGTTNLRQLILNVPPPLDAETVTPGVASEITIPAVGERPAVTYHVILPPEYSPHRLYPCLLALRPEHKSTQATAHWWAGGEDQHGWAQRRGYIVIAPQYAPNDQREYRSSATAHEAILATLHDARLRFAVDSDRVFLTGHDMGADAAFDIGLSHPDEFAGVIPIGGVSEHYGRFYRENAQYTSWYVIRGELGRDASTTPMSEFLDDFFIGARYDIIYVEFMGRGLDAFADELPRIFEWMELHVRRPVPAEFEYRTLRQMDHQPYWITAAPLPRSYVLPPPPGGPSGVEVMKIEGRVTPGNTVSVTSPASHHILRLYDGLIDLDRKVTVRVNARMRLSKFVEPDIRTMLDDFRATADRQRLASVVLQF